MWTVDKNWVKAVREIHGLTQEALAKLLGTKKQAVSEWERGLGFPSTHTICKIADALGVDPARIFVKEG